MNVQQIKFRRAHLGSIEFADKKRRYVSVLHDDSDVDLHDHDNDADNDHY